MFNELKIIMIFGFIWKIPAPYTGIFIKAKTQLTTL